MVSRLALGRAAVVGVLLICTVLAACGQDLQPDHLTALPGTLAPPASTIPRPTPVAAAPPTTPPRSAGRSWATNITFYGAGDNDPAGSAEIAHPNARHGEAGGTGTYANPITLASDGQELAIGTIVYYPALEKYFVMEDDCMSCIAEWRSSQRPHIDLWAGNFGGSRFLACQDTLTPDGPVRVEVDPPPGRPVRSRPLYGSGGCVM